MPKFKKMTTRLTILILTLLFAGSVKGQVNDNEMRQLVLKKGITDSLFVFGQWTKTGGTETHLKYLGQVTTRDGKNFKVMNSCWFWGLSHRATSRILIFNDKNQYIGNFCLNTTYDLPDKLKNGKLVFTNTDNEDCDKSIDTSIDISEGLPKQIFIKCDGENGDLYDFQQN
jgi:hypothetical protein